MNFGTGLDHFVIFIYFSIIILIALRTGKKQQVKSGLTSLQLEEEQFLAGRNIGPWQSVFSIIATEVSTLTFLGIPAFCFNQNFSILHFYFGAFLGRFIIAKYLLPKIYQKHITVYSTFGKASGSVSAQKLITVIFIINKVLAVGVRLFSGSILIKEFFGLDIYTSITLVTACTFAYTFIGGLKAVIMTDVMQFFIFVFGGFIALYLIPDYGNSNFSEYFNSALDLNKLSLFPKNGVSSIIFGLMGGFLFDISTHGIDQDFAQRLLSTRTRQAAQKSIFISGIFSILVSSLFLLVGAFLYVYFQEYTYPEGVKADYLFAWFITNYFPAGIKGFMVAAVMATTMSSLDSAINAIMSVVFCDLRQEIDIKDYKKLYVRDIILTTFAFLIIAFISSQSSQILILGLKLASWTGGTLLAVVGLGLFYADRLRFNFKSVFISYALSLGFIYLFHVRMNSPWELNVYIGFIIPILIHFFFFKKSKT
ncbi:hypothetical protein N9N67_03330 [Bacteriovoracaceae bacterium]|nr:hypothetical protein [Bacteriovoracaceae bacterium]